MEEYMVYAGAAIVILDLVAGALPDKYAKYPGAIATVLKKIKGKFESRKK